MKKLIYSFMVLLTIHACQAQQPSSVSKVAGKESTKEVVYRDVDIAMAKKIVSTNRDMIILDVRTPAEVASGKIDKSLNIDFQAVDFREKLAKLDKNESYLVYCQAGGRSVKAVSIMKDMGFISVYHMKDGYREWK